MLKVKNGLIPDAFQNKFNMISHDYFTKSSMCNFKEPRLSLKVNCNIVTRTTSLE